MKITRRSMSMLYDDLIIRNTCVFDRLIVKMEIYEKILQLLCALFTIEHCLQHVETTKHTKKTLRKTPKARDEALKTSKEPKSKRDDIRKSLKKRRQADRVTCITLDDEVMPIDEQSTSEPQASGMEAEMSISAGTTNSNAGVSKWRKFQHVFI